MTVRDVRYVGTDCDGTLTDGGVFVGPHGEVAVRFSRRDGKGFELLRNAGVVVDIYTQEESPITAQRALKLRVGLFHGLGRREKAAEFRKNVAALGIARENTAYFGDDVNDLDAMDEAGWVGCPKDAHPEVVRYVTGTYYGILTRTPGGHGAFREFADHLLMRGGET